MASHRTNPVVLIIDSDEQNIRPIGSNEGGPAKNDRKKNKGEKKQRKGKCIAFFGKNRWVNIGNHDFDLVGRYKWEGSIAIGNNNKNCDCHSSG